MQPPARPARPKQHPGTSRIRIGCTPTAGPRSFATVLVLWAVAIASLVLLSVQGSSWRQSALGREAVARVRAEWAARAGVEATIASLAADTLNPDLSNAYRTYDDLAEVSTGSLTFASYSISHFDGTNELDGPADAHAKLNINAMTREDLLTFLDMSEDVADSILDWVDADDDTRDLGAETSYYLRNKAFRYAARNAPMRSLQELELVAGVEPTLVRGEDWNLNGILDPNEDDGDFSFPPDNSDGKLDAGWSQHLTASSIDGGLTVSGNERLDLRTASSSDVQTRLGLDREQAEAIAAHAAGLNATLEDFLRADLATLARQANASQLARRARALTDDQLVSLWDEAALAPSGTEPSTIGKLNINTCDKETLQHLAGIDPILADVIIIERDSRGQGFNSLIDLLDVPAITRARLASLVPILCTRSNVFVVNSRGRDEATGLEVEITATIDRSTLPIVIRDYLVK